jgi:tetratricopeptide (TPR) repeat protein
VTQPADQTSASFYRDAFEAHMRGDMVVARASYRLSLTLDPANAKSLHLLGVLFYQQADLRGAVSLIQRAIRVNPYDATYLSNLALAWLELAEPQKGLRLTMTALVLDPSFGDALVNHGGALRECRRYPEAVEFGQRGAWLRPALSAAHSSLGHSLYFRERHNEAVQKLRLAVVLQPNNGKALHVLGLTLATCGMKDEIKPLIWAWRMMPERLDFFASLAEFHHFSLGDAFHEALLTFEAAYSSFEPRRQVLLSFVMAKAAGDMDQRQQAFDYHARGNRIKRTQVAYDEEITLGMFDRVLDLFTPSFIAERSGCGDPSDTPIFIVGLPRSGTSLIEQILSSHPDVYGAGELGELPRLLDFLDPSGMSAFPESLVNASAATIRDLGRAYLDFIRQKNDTARRITDKLPGNVPFAGFIHLALPNARIIQVRRDPVDACLSCFSNLFYEDLNYTYDLAELGRFAGRYVKLMNHWEMLLPPSRLMSLHYEELVEDQEAQTRRLLEFCGLPWDAACLNFHESTRAVRTASIRQIRKPLYKSSVGRWRPDSKALEPLLRGLAE